MISFFSFERSTTSIRILGRVFVVLQALLFSQWVVQAAGSPEEMEVTDSFSSSSRGGGTLLDGQKSERGGIDWEASPSVCLGEGVTDGYLSLAAPGTFIAKIPLPENPGKVTIAAKINPTAEKEPDGWVGIGVGNPGVSSTRWLSGILFILHSNGFYEIISPQGEGALEVVKKGSRPDFKEGKESKVRLEFDSETRIVSIFLDDVNVAKEVDVSAYSVEPLHAAVCGFNQKAAKGLVDFVEVSTHK